MGLKVGSTIRLDHCAANGKTCSKSDFGRRNASLVTGRKWNNEKFYKPILFFRLLPEDLQSTAVLTSKDNVNVNKREFDDALENQFLKRWRKEEISLDAT